MPTINEDTSLNELATELVKPGKGILAADESTGSIKRRLDTIGVENTEENRRAYREMLFTTTGLEQYISGVIMFDETISQLTHDGVLFADLLRNKGMVPGIKVDLGGKPLALSDGELVTEGLDGLRDRLREYHGLGARFAKWRGILPIGNGKPSDYAISANAHALARYAALCVEESLVPIVEPEVLMDGLHDLATCRTVTTRVLHKVFDELRLARVPPNQVLLKPNMVISGKECPVQAPVDDVATATVEVLTECVPASVPGIVFLSGGQSEEQATQHLNAMNRKYKNLPWALSFSYGRALQASALRAWRGKFANKDAAQKALLERSRMNSQACLGLLSDSSLNL